MRHLRSAVIGLGLAIAPAFSSAALLVDENFNYPNGAALDGQNGGFGMLGPWTVGTGPALPAAPGARTIQPADLGFGTTGKHVVMNSGGENTRSLAVGFGADGTTKYISFTLRPDTAIDPNTSTGLMLGGGTTRIFIGKPNVGNQLNYALEQSGGNGQQFSTFAAVQGQAVRLVVRADFAAGNDTLRLYVSPGGSEPLVADATLSAFNTGVISYLGVNSFGGGATPLVTGMNSSLGQIRIGDTYAEVVPEPGSLALLAVASAVFLKRKRR